MGSLFTQFLQRSQMSWLSKYCLMYWQESPSAFFETPYVSAMFCVTISSAGLCKQVVKYTFPGFWSVDFLVLFSFLPEPWVSNSTFFWLKRKYVAVAASTTPCCHWMKRAKRWYLSYGKGETCLAVGSREARALSLTRHHPHHPQVMLF